jgi:hypothetical protein
MTINCEINITDILTTVLSVGISVLIVVIGWNRDRQKDREQATLEQKLNRENEIAKELRDYREKMLESFQRLFIFIMENGRNLGQDDVPRLNDLIADFSANATSFCTSDELDIFRRINAELEKAKKSEQNTLYKEFFDFKNAVHNNIRRELSLAEITFE